MKKFTVILLLFLLFFCGVPIEAGADEAFDENEYQNQLDSYDLSFFKKELDKDSYSFLEELGLTDFGFEDLSSLSFERVLNIALKIIKTRLNSPLKGLLSIMLYVFISSLFQSLKSDSSDMGNLFSTVSSLIVSLVLIAEISPSITLSAASVKIASDFIFAFIPVFFLLVMSSGGITISLSTNTMLLTLAQALSALESNIFIPMINCFLCIGICSGLRNELQLQRVVSSLKRGITTVLSFTSGAFVSVLSFKTAVASRADALGVRSMRFMINSVVPVVGGILSEGLLSIQGYSSLIKSSVGLVGIGAIVLVFLPSIIEVTLWRGALSVALTVCDIFGDKSVSLVLTAFKDTMLLISVVLIISMLTTVISIGILVAAGR